MVTSSFTKNFILDNKKTVDSFSKIISTPAESVKIHRTLTLPKRVRQGEIRLKQILSR